MGMIGVWHDAGARRAHEYAQLYRELGISYVQVMIDQQAVPVPGGVRPLRRWDEAMVYPVVSRLGDRCPSLTATVHTFRDAGLEVGITYWPHLELPDGAYDEDGRATGGHAAYQECLAWCAAYLPISNIDADCEHYNALSHGRDEMIRVMPGYVDAIRSADLVRETPCEVWIDVDPGWPHDKGPRDISEHLITCILATGGTLDALATQGGYSRYQSAYSSVDQWGHETFGPGTQQRIAAREWREAVDHCRRVHGVDASGAELVMGAAWYDQQYPRRTVEEAVHKHLSASAELGVRVCGWSGRNLRAHPDVARAIQSWTRSNA